MLTGKDLHKSGLQRPQKATEVHARVKSHLVPVITVIGVVVVMVVIVVVVVVVRSASGQTIIVVFVRAHLYVSDATLHGKPFLEGSFTLDRPRI